MQIVFRNGSTAPVSDAPRCYARAQLGANVRRYMVDRGWIDRRTIVRMERAAAAYRIAELIDAARSQTQVTA